MIRNNSCRSVPTIVIGMYISMLLSVAVFPTELVTSFSTLPSSIMAGPLSHYSVENNNICHDRYYATREDNTVSAPTTHAVLLTPPPSAEATTNVWTENRPEGQTHKSLRNRRNSDWLWKDFKTHTGEILDPYAILKIKRDAERRDIKTAYWNLSKKYHPDKARFRDILPGNCNDMEDVRNEWERIKLSYEMLSDRKQRIKYDRNSAIQDPSSAMGRAAMSFLGWGIENVVKGVMEVGMASGAALTNAVKETKKGTQ